MEFAILTGLGLAGYYISGEELDADNYEGNRQNDPFRNYYGNAQNFSMNSDIYNQNRLYDDDVEMKKRTKRIYDDAKNPSQTGVIPPSYNKLKPFIREEPNDLQYDKDEDIDQIYRDMPLKKTRGLIEKGNPSEVFRKNKIDTQHTFLRDEYQVFSNYPEPFVINGVERNTKPKYIKKEQKSKTAKEIIESFSGVDQPDKDLLSVSENLTDNGDSIRRIMEGSYNQIPTKLNPYEMEKSGRLVGVTPDYGSILVDDEIASYPEFDRYTKPNNKTLEETNSCPNFLSQFEEQTYDNEGLPGAQNDTYSSSDKSRLSDIERQLAFQGGWTQYDQAGKMTYGIVSDDKLLHDNMVPFFREKNGYGSNDNHSTEQMDRYRDLFTGNLTVEWKKKEEIPKLFAPTKDMSYIYGTPVRPEGEEDRIFTSKYRNNERLFQPERVTPGLNLDYNEIGTHGYHDLVVVYPKTVDDLRVASRPKVTYEGRIIEGRKGWERPVIGQVVSHRPDGFKITTEADLLPKADLNDGPRSRENFVVREQARETTSVEYTGGAYNRDEALNQAGPSEMRAFVQESSKQNFTMPIPLQKYAKEETIYNPNINSFNIQANARSDTTHNNYLGHSSSTSGGAVYSNKTDEAKPTLREGFGPIDNARIGSANTMRGMTIQMDMAKPTIKQVTAEQSLNPGMIAGQTSQKVYFTDPAKTTIRQTLKDNLDPSNLYTTTGGTVYANNTDTPRITLKETIVTIPQNKIVLPVGQSQGAVHFTDSAKTTTKEQTSSIMLAPHTVLSNQGQSQGKTHLQDIAKTTLKEEFTTLSLNTNFTPVGQNMGAVGLQDKMKTTSREQTEGINRPTILTNIGQNMGAVPLQDISKRTIREQTEILSRQSFLSNRGQEQGATHLQDIVKTTLREQTEGLDRPMTFTPVGQNQGSVHLQDKTKTTLKEQTEGINRPNFITPADRGIGKASPQDVAKTTVKELTVDMPINTFLYGVDQSQGQAPLQDLAKTTIREQLVESDHPMRLSMVGQSQGKSSPQDQAKTTIKEQSVALDRPTFITPVNQSQGAVPLQDQAKTTIKEQLIDTKYISNNTFTTFGSGYGYISAKNQAPNTNKQFTSLEVYVPPLLSQNLKPTDYSGSYNARISDVRESTQVYRAPTSSGFNKGPSMEYTQTYMKDDLNQKPNVNHAYLPNNLGITPEAITTIKTISTIKPSDNVPVTMFVDPIILSQLKNNPFSQPQYYPNPYNK